MATLALDDSFDKCMCCMRPITNNYDLGMVPDVDLHCVRIIRAISQHGTISAAAVALGFSQPAVSQHLRKTEARLGFPLVVRVGRGIHLTEPGKLVAKHSTGILAALGALSGDLAELAGLSAGTVRVAAFPTASSTLIPRLLKIMRATYPGIAVTYVEAEPPEALSLLRDGAADLAITFSYPGDRADPHRGSGDLVDSLPLFTEKVVLVMPDAHPLASDDAVSLAALSDERWIAGCPVCRGHLLAVCDAVGIDPQIELETDNSVAVLSLVAEGLGIALLPQLALATAPLTAGVTARPTEPSSDRSIQALVHSGSRTVPSIAATIDALMALDGRDWGLNRATP